MGANRFGVIDFFALACAQIGALITPVVAPRIETVFAASPSRVFPFFLSRQTVSHAIPRRAPHRELICVVQGNVYDGELLLSFWRIVSRPSLGRRISALLYELGVLGVGDFGAIHEEWLNGDRVRGALSTLPIALRRIVTAHHKRTARNPDNVGQDRFGWRGMAARLMLWRRPRRAIDYTTAAP